MNGLKTEVIFDIGVELHKDRKKAWGPHEESMLSYMNAIYSRRGFSHVLISSPDDPYVLEKVAYGHDLMKKIHGYHKVIIDGTVYVVDIPEEKPYLDRSNVIPIVMRDLSRAGLSNEDVQQGIKDLISVEDYHALNAAAWLSSQGETNLAVLLAIMMHSCPIPSIYQKLPIEFQELIDITMLADKCSKNVIKAYGYGQPVPVLLPDILFGRDHREFNYTSALLIAKIIQGGKKPNDIHKASIKMYRHRCEEIGLPVPKKCRYDSIDNSIVVDERKKNEVKEELIRLYGNIYNETHTRTESSGEGSEESE